MVSRVRDGSGAIALKPCDHCGGDGKLFKRQIHATTHNRMPYFSTTFIVYCTACKCSTRRCDTEVLAAEEWQTGRVGFPERGLADPIYLDLPRPFEAGDLFLKAAIAVSKAGFGSNEVVRTALGIGYSRARELIVALQAEGILGEELDEHARLELLRPIGFY